MTITIPPSLSQADAAIGLISLFHKILDPSERKKISDDIASFHALNETEHRKAEEARALIKEHSDKLASIRNESDNLDKKKFEFDKDYKEKTTTLEKKSAQIDANAIKANETLESNIKILKDIEEREKRLSEEKEQHKKNLELLEEEKHELINERKRVAEYEQKVKEKDDAINIKIEKLKQFNF